MIFTFCAMSGFFFHFLTVCQTSFILPSTFFHSLAGVDAELLRRALVAHEASQRDTSSAKSAFYGAGSNTHIIISMRQIIHTRSSCKTLRSVSDENGLVNEIE